MGTLERPEEGDATAGRFTETHDGRDPGWLARGGTAVIAAQETATAAHTALEAARLADASATRTAETARLVVESVNADLGAATEDSDQADLDEIAARDLYQSTVAEAESRADP